MHIPFLHPTYVSGLREVVWGVHANRRTLRRAALDLVEGCGAASLVHLTTLRTVSNYALSILGPVLHDKAADPMTSNSTCAVRTEGTRRTVVIVHACHSISDSSSRRRQR
jgi:hypothetical protein